MIEFSLAEVVEALSYKPGWQFWLEGRGTLVIRAEVQHSETFETVRFDIKRLIPHCALVTPAIFVSWVQDMLTEAEIHELREFFRYKGELVDNPHASRPT